MTTTRPLPAGFAPRETILGRAMVSNAWFSGVSGVVMAAGAEYMDTWSGIDRWLLVGIGVALVLFAVGLAICAGSQRWLMRCGVVAVAGDAGWVAAAVGLIVFTDTLTKGAELVLAAVTVVVSVFGIAQTVGLAKLKRGG